MSGSEAATKYKSFLNQAASAGKKLGLSFVDANNQLLSTPEILEKLHGKYGDTIDAVEKQKLKEAFGTDEAVAMIDLLYNDIEGLSGGIDAMAESMKQGTSVTTEMAEAINNTPAQKFEVLKQQIHNNVEELGSKLLPVVNETMDKVSGAIQKGSEWISNNQKTVQTIMDVALKLGVILIVLGTVIGIIGTVGKTIIAAKNAITAVKSAWTVLSGAFAASPVGWVVIGIIALVAAFVILWNKSEAFRNFWKGLFEQVKSAVMQAWSSIQPALQNLGSKLMELWQAVQPIIQILEKAGAVILVVLGSIFAGAIQGALSALTPLIDAFSSFVSFVTDVVNAVVALFRGDFSGAIDFASSAVDDFKNFVENGFNAILSFIGGFASGFLDAVGVAFSSIGIDAGEAITNMKDTVKNGLEAVKGFFGNIMGAAADTAKEKLDNIKNAYEENGGGIEGLVAASQEAIKGRFSAGFTFIDNLTGGRLTELRQKFANGMQGAADAVNEKLNSIKDKFNERMTAVGDLVNGAIERIKSFFNVDLPTPRIKMPHVSISGGFSISPPSVPKFSIDWYAEGGIMTNPTIFGAAGGKLLGGGEAGDEAILPLSALWEKLKTFIHNEMGQNDEKKQGNAGAVVSALTKKETRTLESRETKVTERKTQEPNSASGKANTIIQKLEIKVSIDKLKDLPLLYKLIDEIKDAQNSTDEPEMA